MPPGTTHAIALFDLAATPESREPGPLPAPPRGAALPAGAALAVLLDEIARSRRRFAGLGERLAQRRDAWRRWGEALGTVPVALALDGPAAADASTRLQAAFAAPAGAGPT